MKYVHCTHTHTYIALTVSVCLFLSLYLYLFVQTKNHKKSFTILSGVEFVFQFNTVVVLNCVGKCSGIKKNFRSLISLAKNVLSYMRLMNGFGSIVFNETKAINRSTNANRLSLQMKTHRHDSLTLSLKYRHTHRYRDRETQKTQIFAFVCIFFISIETLFDALLLSRLKNFNKSRRWKMNTRLAIEND